VITTGRTVDFGEAIDVTDDANILQLIIISEIEINIF
jgi:hypothetical protein